MPFHNSYCSPPAGNSTPPHTHFLKPHPDCRQTALPTPVFLRRMWTFSLASFCQSFAKFFCCLSSEGVGKHSGKQTHTQTLLGDTLWARAHLPVWFIYSHPKKTTKKTSPADEAIGFAAGFHHVGVGGSSRRHFVFCVGMRERAALIWPKVTSADMNLFVKNVC